MKKLLAALMAALTLFSLAGCGKEESKEPIDMFRDSIAELLGKESLTAEMDGTLAMTMMGATLEMEVNGDMKLAKLTEDLPETAVVINISFMGMSIALENYTTGGYTYTSAGGSKTKTPIEPDADTDETGNFGEEFRTAFDEGIKPTVTETLAAETETEGVTLITVKFDAAALSNLINESGGGEASATRLKELTAEALISKDGQLQSLKLIPVLASDSDAGEMDVAGEILIAVSDMNGTVIEFPDFSDYIESETGGGIPDLGTILF